MLTCYGDNVRLPQNDLVYLAFRLALRETLADIELQHFLGEVLLPWVSSSPERATACDAPVRFDSPRSSDLQISK
jgi:hypothetical protein